MQSTVGSAGRSSSSWLVGAARFLYEGQSVIKGVVLTDCNGGCRLGLIAYGTQDDKIGTNSVRSQQRLGPVYQTTFDAFAELPLAARELGYEFEGWLEDGAGKNSELDVTTGAGGVAGAGAKAVPGRTTSSAPDSAKETDKDIDMDKDMLRLISDFAALKAELQELRMTSKLQIASLKADVAAVTAEPDSPTRSSVLHRALQAANLKVELFEREYITAAAEAKVYKQRYETAAEDVRGLQDRLQESCELLQDWVARCRSQEALANRVLGDMERYFQLRKEQDACSKASA